MSFVDDEQFKTALISYLKELDPLLERIPAAEVRETQWQGTTFTYPNVRVRVIDNRPFGSRCHHKIQVGIQVNSEEQSSKEADEISGIIGRALSDCSFARNGVYMILQVTNLIPALRVDVRTWRSEALFTVIASLVEE